jgi:hypothetical protein
MTIPTTLHPRQQPLVGYLSVKNLGTILGAEGRWRRLHTASVAGVSAWSQAPVCGTPKFGDTTISAVKLCVTNHATQEVLVLKLGGTSCTACSATTCSTDLGTHLAVV